MSQGDNPEKSGWASDHDQRFKTLIREFFAEFFRLFFPAWADRFDFGRVEWLDTQAFPDPPQGRRQSLDLVAKLPTTQAVPAERPGQEESWIALVHVEVESRDSVAPLRPRMLDYYHFLRQQHGLPVLPVALYLRVGLDGIGCDVYEERFWERTLLYFEYQYVGLPALDALDYLERDNLLGVALTALMRVPEERKAWLRAEALRRLYQSGENTWRTFLLCECVQAYLALDPAQQAEFNRLLDHESYSGVKVMATTWFEQGLEQGLAQGRNQGQRQFLQMMLERKFGPLTPQARQRLESWPAERLVDAGLALSQAQSLRDLGLED